MGIGGTPTAGCNIGNGLTGFSILATQGVVAIGCIALSRWAVDAAGAAGAARGWPWQRQRPAPVAPGSTRGRPGEETMRSLRAIALLLVGAGLWPVASPAAAQPPSRGEVTTVAVKRPFAEAADGLKAAIAANGMGLVCHANAQAGAASRGVKIKGNQVLMVFRPDFAIRMLAAAVEAGLEAPIRIYITENDDGTATIRYVKPSAVFRPYAHPDLDRLGAELDPIFERILAAAAR